jgi:hypothetical protein
VREGGGGGEEHQRGLGWALLSSPTKFGQCSDFVNGKLLARTQGVAGRKKNREDEELCRE